MIHSLYFDTFESLNNLKAGRHDMIQCQNVCKSFNQKIVINEINLEIPDGQIFGLLGPSGAGKSTLIKILTGQLAFDSGSVTILDKRAENLTGKDKKKIGIMMEEFGVYERLSCIDYLGNYDW